MASQSEANAHGNDQGADGLVPTIQVPAAALSGEHVAKAREVVEQARKRGFYDFMLGRSSNAQAIGLRLEVSYGQGQRLGALLRARLDGRAWYETEKSRSGGRWAWRIYREGYFRYRRNGAE